MHLNVMVIVITAGVLASNPIDPLRKVRIDTAARATHVDNFG
ncbi:hypothetical protein [Paeniglutamicibacter psychrophenolicus]|nr:hypothetical protein [Paeniglutamicibacter psychrophenolicus]MDQ0096019.1 hypothetical protein [Paeniglutamicibacter psychrophenolicus]